MMEPADVIDAAFREMCRPFRWDGISDCSGAACAGFVRLTGVDLMDGLRGRYSDRAGAIALIRARGGFLALWRAQAKVARLRVGPEATGQIGVIRTQGTPWRVLGLCVEPGLWAAKTGDGAALVPAQVEMAWNV